MKIKFLTPPILFLIILSFSCKKEAIQEVPSVPVIDDTYLPMSIGSYWVYHWYGIDTLGVEDFKENWIDTIRIIGDTIINNQSYSIHKGGFSAISQSYIQTNYWRDSLGNLLDTLGKINFSSTNFSDSLEVFGGTDLTTVYQMQLLPTQIITPAGTFECLNFQGKATSPFTSWTERISNKYFAKEIGEVQGDYFYATSLYTFQRRLVEYNIE